MLVILLPLHLFALESLGPEAEEKSLSGIFYAYPE
jgi:hypothetical protein